MVPSLKATSVKAKLQFKKYLRNCRWYNEYGKAYNLKQFRLNLSTAHASDLREYASYQSYITGSNKIFYLHEHFKVAVWRAVEALDPPVTDSAFQIPSRPSAQLKLLHLTTMVNVTEALFLRYMSYDCPIAHPGLVPGADAGALQANNSFVPGTPNSGIDAAWGRGEEKKPQNFTTGTAEKGFVTEKIVYILTPTPRLEKAAK